MSNMFSNCSSLTSLDLSNFNTNNVEDISGIYYINQINKIINKNIKIINEK